LKASFAPNFETIFTSKVNFDIYVWKATIARRMWGTTSAFLYGQKKVTEVFVEMTEVNIFR
jgi:hypothetical protein